MGLWPPTPFNIDGNPFARKDGPLVKSGSLPNSCADMAIWTGESIWTVGHNLKNVTGSPNVCDAFSDGTTFQLRRLGTKDMTLYPAPQLGYGSQSIARVTTADSLIYWSGAAWTYSTVTPTIYLLTFRFSGTPATGQKHWSGLAGDGLNGWQIEAHAESGIRLALGNGTSGFNLSSYIGGTAFYDGRWYTMAIAIDYVNSKARISCGGYNAEMTAIAIGSPAILLKTIGPTYTGDTWSAPVDYAVSAKGVGANAYRNMDAMLSNFTARL